MDTAIQSAATVGAFGLLVALYSGIGWMTNLRDALSEQWGQVPEPPPLVRRLLVDLLSLLGLGVALVVSFAVTGLATGFAATVLGFLGLAEQAWAKVLLVLLGVVLGIAANWLIFLWVIARLPREDVALQSAVRAALLGAVGFEVIKQIMTFYLTRSPSRPAARSSARSSACSCSCTSCRGSCCSSRRGRRRRRRTRRRSRSRCRARR